MPNFLKREAIILILPALTYICEQPFFHYASINLDGYDAGLSYG